MKDKNFELLTLVFFDFVSFSSCSSRTVNAHSEDYEQTTENIVDTVQNPYFASTNWG